MSSKKYVRKCRYEICDPVLYFGHAVFSGEVVCRIAAVSFCNLFP